MAGVVLTLLVLTSVVLVDSPLISLYMNHNMMATVMGKISQDDYFALQQDAKIREAMRKRLKINNIRKFDLKEHLKIALGRDGTELLLSYEERVDVFANLGGIAVFENKVLLRDYCGAACPI